MKLSLWGELLTEPQNCIDDLDAALADAGGEDVTLRRVMPSPESPVDVACRAAIRGLPSERNLIGGVVTDQDQHFVLSPTPIDAAGWPGLGADTNTAADQRIPLNGDQLITTRGTLTILIANGIYVQTVLVRIEGRARGQ